MKSIIKKYIIHSDSKTVWRVLTEPKLIEKWTGSRCKMSGEQGSEFSLWNGDIWGKNIIVVKEKQLIQEWYAGTWSEPSIAKFDLEEKGENTFLILEHSNIPDEEAEAIDRGWDMYYLEPIKLLSET